VRSFGREPRLPRDVAARVPGRALAFAEADDTWLIGTRAELVILGPQAATRIPWERVEGADWDRDLSRLRITEVGEFGRPRPSYAFTLHEQEPTTLLQLIRERVTASVVLQRGQLVAGKRGFKVIGRRSPVGGPIAWMHEYDEGVDPLDPDVAAAAEALLRHARDDVGE
jgi:hypothetical protein